MTLPLCLLLSIVWDGLVAIVTAMMAVATGVIKKLLLLMLLLAALEFLRSCLQLLLHFISISLAVVYQVATFFVHAVSIVFAELLRLLLLLFRQRKTTLLQ